MPFLLAEILNFQGSTHLIGVGSFSNLVIVDSPMNKLLAKVACVKAFSFRSFLTLFLKFEM